MLNVDEYREAILCGDPEKLPCYIAALRCHAEPCDGEHCLDCMRKNHEWLLKEYEPPLLKNGDGLKPGDWIMVREHEHDSWDKMRFACFVDGLFYVIDDALGSEVFKESGTNITGWEQARLPEEGE